MAITGFDTAELGSMAIENVGASLAPLEAYSFKVEATENKTIKVPVVNAMDNATAYNNSTNNYTTATTGGGASTVSVVVNTHKKGTFELDLKNRKAINPDTMTKLWEEAIKCAVREFNTDVMGTVLAANFATVQTTALADFDLTAHGTLRNALETLLVGDPNDMYTTILSSSYYNALRLDSDARALMASAGNLSMVTGSVLPQLDNCSIIKSAVPANSQNLVGFITNKTGIAVGFDLEQDRDGDGFEETVVTHGKSGISLTLREERKNGTDLVYCTASIKYGFKAVNPKGILRLRSAA